MLMKNANESAKIYIGNKSIKKTYLAQKSKFIYDEQI